MSKVWLVTGSASGLGRHIAEAVLQSGDCLLAAARQIDRLEDLKQCYPSRILPFELDVTDASAAKAAVDAAVSTFGRLDVLVNNAGFGHMLPFEQIADADFRLEFETNFFGVVNLCRAAVPVLREQGAGRIVQISSVGGRMATVGLSAYQSAKWAVGGFSDVLAAELKPLGVHVTTLEPGGMRTQWAVRARGSDVPYMSAYEQNVGQMRALLRTIMGNENSDPERVAQVILKLVEHPQPPLRLLLGSDARHYLAPVEANRADTAERWKEVSESVDFSCVGPVPALPES
ncbi:SDR family NAD(P)-dependent oxidoreductase [Pseudomonas sp. GD03842]|uniref:SDR family NAD(P)-dependent oxidoreductase n=1 Tax=Pseudomonas sp. GD03842 TaxID=2975385 RepID=UPI00244901E5|nr:SDR family NAD(P)-dependent oxidoreductase [Pseudomonas sp. GD03842]MDH0745328.1 SDR family NAD(P)-dependent oxidoreductase [Pseudomonas sp. GD03842]